MNIAYLDKFSCYLCGTSFRTKYESAMNFTQCLWYRVYVTKLFHICQPSWKQKTACLYSYARLIKVIGLHLSTFAVLIYIHFGINEASESFNTDWRSLGLTVSSVISSVCSREPLAHYCCGLDSWQLVHCAYTIPPSTIQPAHKFPLALLYINAPFTSDVRETINHLLPQMQNLPTSEKQEKANLCLCVAIIIVYQFHRRNISSSTRAAFPFPVFKCHINPLGSGWLTLTYTGQEEACQVTIGWLRDFDLWVSWNQM